MVSKKLLAFCLLVFAMINSCRDKDESTVAKSSVTTEKSLSDAVSRYPDSLPLRVKLIQLYSDSNNYKMAIKITDDGIARDTANPELWDIRASVLYQNEDTLGAIKAFEKAISIIPLPDYLISLGSLYAQTKNDKALLVADELFADRNAKAQKEALFIKGLYYSYLGSKQQSIGYFDKCINMDYTYMFAYREKAICLYDLGKYNDAIMVLNKAVTIQNSFDEGYYWLGKCYEKLNRPNDAIDNYKMALLYDKDFIEARDALNHLQPK